MNYNDAQSDMLQIQQLCLHNATVTAICENKVIIDINGIIEEALIAFSCIIKPIAGDTVLCSATDTGSIYILGIIERNQNNTATLSFPSDVSFVSETGNVTIVSPKSLSLTAGNTLNGIAEKTFVKSNDGVVDINICTAHGTKLDISYKTLSIISQFFTTLVNQCIAKMKNYIRHTEEYDQVKAGHITRSTDGLYSVDSRHTIMVSKKDTKIDGERIHMG
jgi:Protein of unknown function (DUF3540)